MRVLAFETLFSSMSSKISNLSHLSDMTNVKVLPIGVHSDGYGRNLSNSLYTPFEFDGHVYPSADHAFHAQTVVVEQRSMFQTGGVLASIHTGLKLLWSNYEHESNRTRMVDYLCKEERCMIGMVARFATHHGSPIPLIFLPELTFQETTELWMRVLRAKYSDPFMQNELLITNNMYLLQYNPFQEAEPNKTSRWSGRVINGVLHGYNHMGNIMMRLRRELQHAAE